MWGKTEYMAMMSNNSSTDIVKFMAPGSEVQDMGGRGGGAIRQYGVKHLYIEIWPKKNN